jgi:hypothetical protein
MEEGRVNIMDYGLKKFSRKGTHYDLAIAAAKRIKQVKFLIKHRDEKDIEHHLVSSLETYRNLKPHLITQLNKEQPVIMTRAELFGFRHSPDVAIGDDGTVIELKLIKSSQSVRELLGQAMCYRVNYRFVILVFVAPETPCLFIKLCSQKRSNEHKLLNALSEDFGIFSVVGPTPNGKNLSFGF